MKNNTPITTASHHELRSLLPWYVNQSLNPEESAQVEQHIRQCLLCHRELISLRKLAYAVVQPSDLQSAAEISFAQLSAKLSENNVTPTADKQKTKPFLTPVLGYALAASVVLALIPLALKQNNDTSQAEYSTLSSPVSKSQKNELRLVFKPATPETVINEVLTQINGQKMSENSLGALTVRLNNENPNLEQTLVLLRQRQELLLAEPVLP